MTLLQSKLSLLSLHAFFFYSCRTVRLGMSNGPVVRDLCHIIISHQSYEKMFIDNFKILKPVLRVVQYDIDEFVRWSEDWKIEFTVEKNLPKNEILQRYDETKKGIWGRRDNYYSLASFINQHLIVLLLFCDHVRKINKGKSKFLGEARKGKYSHNGKKKKENYLIM